MLSQVGAAPLVPPATEPMPAVLMMPRGWLLAPLPAMAARSIISAMVRAMSMRTNASTAMDDCSSRRRL